MDEASIMPELHINTQVLILAQVITVVAQVISVMTFRRGGMSKSASEMLWAGKKRNAK